MSLRKIIGLFKGNLVPTTITSVKYTSAAVPSLRSSSSDEKFNVEAVIFDKDGTLVCFHTMWTPWCTSLAERMTNVAGIDLKDPLYDVLGYDHINSKVRIGALAENTHPQIKDKITDMLTKHPEVSCAKKARKVVELSWRDTPENMRIKLTGNMKYLFSQLKSHGVKIAICTSDSREGTELFLQKQELSDLVDMVVCGDDSFGKPKPDPHNARLICETLKVHPSATIMVGDTPADTLMGQEANLGLTIGVLSGVGNQADLADADVIVQDVKEVVDMLLPPNDVKTVHRVTSRGLFKIARGAMYQNQSQSQSQTQRRAYSSYSHVIVGGGSAGCVLANRLSEERKNSVCLLEAGPKDRILGSKTLQWKIHMPAALTYNLCDDKYNWYYHTLPQRHLNNRIMYWPRGRVWGGSSSLNAMVYIRGHPYDYDRWEKEGAQGWNYFSCLPYFKKAQCHEYGENAYRGGSGPLHVSRGTSGNELHKAWLKAGQEAGYPFTEDVNGYQQEGVSEFELTIYKGQRWSTATAYLYPALSRPNLKVESRVLATKILFDGLRAIGVEYVQKGETKRILADEEVIISGGAINSPQLLMLSGIGDADHLKQLDIPVVAHLPGVGQNLQDHLEIYVQQKCVKPITLFSDQKGLRMIKVGLQWFLNKTGPAATTHLESGGFIRSRPGVEHPDIMFHFLPSQVIDHGRKPPIMEAYQVHVGPMRATSRGWIKLQSKDPRAHPLLQPNYLSTEIDRWEMREAVKLSREIFSQPAFDEYRGEEAQPGNDAKSDEDLDNFVREKSDSAYHPSCTCKMGSTNDKMAVVDSSTKVIGIERLRVVDASIMPSIASGNLNAPTIMIAERAADIIKGKPMLSPAKVEVYHPKSLDTQR